MGEPASPRGGGLVVCHHRSPPEEVLELARQVGAASWSYLGDDPGQLVRWKRIWGKRLAHLPVGRRIDTAAWDLRDAYIDWVERLGRPYGRSLTWWTSLVGDKNTLASPLFFWLCLLEVCESLAAAQDAASRIVIVQGSALLETIAGNLRRHGRLVRVHRGPWPVVRWERAKRYVWFAGSWTLWLLRTLQSQAAARIQAPRRGGGLKTGDGRAPLAIIHTCIDEDGLSENGDLRDRYFPGLAEWLRRRGYTVAVIPFLHNLQSGPATAVRRMRRSATHFLVPEDFCGLTAYAGAVLTVLRQFWVPQGRMRFKGWDIAPLVDEIRWRQARNTDHVRFLAYAPLFDALKRSGAEPKLFIDKFENMPKEKPPIAFIRRRFPKCTLVGFQHASLPPMMLKYTTRRREFYRGLFPDFVVANGPWFRERLAADGVPAERLRTGPSLRSAFIRSAWGSGGRRRRFGAGPARVPQVLVVLSLAHVLSLELLGKAIPALADGAWQVRIKPHPMSDRRKILRALGAGGLPLGMGWVDGPLEKWLVEADCLVATGSASIMEAAACGVPVVVVGRECGLNLDPLGWWAGRFHEFSPVFSPSEIRTRVRDWISMPIAERQARTDAIRDLLAGCYMGRTEAAMQRFLPTATSG